MAKLQSQWENGLQNMEEYAEDHHPIQKRVELNKSLLIVSIGIAVLVLGIILSVYAFARPIEGVWIRQQDDTRNMGLVVAVRKDGNSFFGEIIEAKGTDFENGQIKWMNIKKVGFGRYKCYDLHAGSGIYNYKNITSTMVVNSGGKTMTIFTDQKTADSGQFQIWHKDTR